jgi:4-hydroxy-tetrahydrodipicolinate reductase
VLKRGFAMTSTTPHHPIRIALPGGAGRMGRMITRLIAENDQLELVASSDLPQAKDIGGDLGLINHMPELGVVLSADPKALFASSPQVIIDFTSPSATLLHTKMAAQHGTAMVIGTTGLSSADRDVIAGFAKSIPIVLCANTSVGVTLLAQLVEQVAKQLTDGWDIEITETHHKHKVDAPSGTALALGHAAAKGRGVLLDEVASIDRNGARSDGNIGFAVMRGGDVAGEHSVIFYGDSERIELTHRANDRIIFARGALRAARWISGQPAGLYSMDDVLKA